VVRRQVSCRDRENGRLMGVPEKRLRFRRRASEHCQLGLTDTWLTASDRRGLTVWEVVARGVAVMIRHCGSDVFGSIPSTASNGPSEGRRVLCEPAKVPATRRKTPVRKPASGPGPVGVHRDRGLRRADARPEPVVHSNLTSRRIRLKSANRSNARRRAAYAMRRIGAT
jgi:hypothetical protein